MTIIIMAEEEKSNSGYSGKHGNKICARSVSKRSLIHTIKIRSIIIIFPIRILSGTLYATRAFALLLYNAKIK